MSKYFLIFLVLLVSACNKPNPIPKLSADAIILAFGDSLTYGTGATPQHDYPSILTALSGRQVINEGVPGEITEQGEERLPKLLDQYQPELLILIHGGNDLLQNLPRQETRANLKKMINEAKKRNIAVMMLGVPNPGLLFFSSADFYKSLAEQQQIPADLNTLPDILRNNALKSDIVHPNDAGYQQLASNIFDFLQDHGAL